MAGLLPVIRFSMERRRNWQKKREENRLKRESPAMPARGFNLIRDGAEHRHGVIHPDPARTLRADSTRGSQPRRLFSFAPVFVRARLRSACPVSPAPPGLRFPACPAHAGRVPALWAPPPSGVCTPVQPPPPAARAPDFFPIAARFPACPALFPVTRPGPVSHRPALPAAYSLIRPALWAPPPPPGAGSQSRRPDGCCDRRTAPPRECS